MVRWVPLHIGAAECRPERALITYVVMRSLNQFKGGYCGLKPLTNQNRIFLNFIKEYRVNEVPRAMRLLKMHSYSTDTKLREVLLFSR